MSETTENKLTYCHLQLCGLLRFTEVLFKITELIWKYEINILLTLGVFWRNSRCLSISRRWGVVRGSWRRCSRQTRRGRWRWWREASQSERGTQQARVESFWQVEPAPLIEKPLIGYLDMSKSQQGNVSWNEDTSNGIWFFVRVMLVLLDGSYQMPKSFDLYTKGEVVLCISVCQIEVSHC